MYGLVYLAMNVIENVATEVLWFRKWMQQFKKCMMRTN